MTAAPGTSTRFGRDSFRPGSASGRVSRLGFHTAVLLCTLASPFLHGYAFGLENQNIQLPHVFALGDPSLYPGDALIAAMGSYFSFFWRAIAWMCERVPAEPLFLALHLVVAWAKFAAVGALARRLFPHRPRVVYLALWLVFWGRSGIGWEPLHWQYLAHTPFATAIGLWTLYAALGGRWRSALLLAGLTFDVHAMQSAYLLLMIAAAAAATLARGERENRSGVWRAFLQGLPLYFLAAAPGLYWMFGTEALDSPPDLVALIRIFFPFHFFVSSFGPGQWLTAVLLIGIFAAALRWAPKRAPVRSALWMVAALFGFWIVGGAIMELAPNAFVLKLHVFRSSSYVCFLLFTLLAGLLDRLWRAGERRGWPPTLAWALALFVVPLGRIEEAPIRDPRFLVPWAAVLLLGGASLWLSRRARLGAGLLAFLLALWPMAWFTLEERRAAQRLHSDREPWREAQRWARANTARDDRFLTPSYLSGFRIGSQRPVVGETQDGSALLWSATYADYWRPWYERMGGRFDDEDITLWDRLARGWFEKDQAELEAIARDYGARYIVLREPKTREAARGWKLDWEGEPLFDNGIFRIYRLEDSSAVGVGEGGG